MSAAAVVEAVRSGQVSAAEVVQAAVARAERAHPELNAVAVPLYEEATAAARAVDGALPLAGVPVSVKESFEVTGTPACGGVEALAVARSQHDADVVAALRAAGAVPIAKGNLAQLLWFAETDNPSTAARITRGRSTARRAARAGGMPRWSLPAWCRSRSVPTSAAASASPRTAAASRR